MTNHPLNNPHLAKVNVSIVTTCDNLCMSIRRIKRRLKKLRPDDRAFTELTNELHKQTATLAQLGSLHYQGKTFIPGAVVRYRKDSKMSNIRPHVYTEKTLIITHEVRQRNEDDLLENCGWKDALERGEVNDLDLFRHSLFVSCCDMLKRVVSIVHIKDNTHINDTYLVTVKY